MFRKRTQYAASENSHMYVTYWEIIPGYSSKFRMKIGRLLSARFEEWLVVYDFAYRIS